MTVEGHPISQTNFSISPIWTPITEEEFRKLQLCPTYIVTDLLKEFLGSASVNMAIMQQYRMLRFSASSADVTWQH
jgi:hypothetical protein